MSSHSFQIDPYDVLGISRESTLQQIRDAYHQKSKRYHPDLGGEEWTFRILHQAYEILSRARVARAAQRQAGPSQAPPSPQPRPGSGHASTRNPTPGEQLRHGLRDRLEDPALIVAIEILWIRFETEQVWLFQSGANQEERSLSCSLNIAWPDQTAIAEVGIAYPDPRRCVPIVKAALDHTIAVTRAISWQSRVEDDQVSGWISFPAVDQAWNAFRTFRDSLTAQRMGVRQWSRDIIIPREWR